jgi:hypothetical protein
MKVYYAHCIALYNTPQELRDRDTLRCLFPWAKIVNPNDGPIEEQCNLIKADYYNGAAGAAFPNAGGAVMALVFKPLVQSCHALAFRALPDGSIPAGVAQEITWAKEAKLPILELPTNLSRRCLSLDQTREYLREVGQR